MKASFIIPDAYERVCVSDTMETFDAVRNAIPLRQRRIRDTEYQVIKWSDVSMPSPCVVRIGNDGSVSKISAQNREKTMHRNALARSISFIGGEAASRPQQTDPDLKTSCSRARTMHFQLDQFTKHNNIHFETVNLKRL